MAAVQPAAGAGLEIGTDGVGFDPAVAFNANRRRGLREAPADDTSAAVATAATGTATMIRAAVRPPRSTRIPTIMRKAPLSFQSRPAFRVGRLPICCTACSQFYPMGKRPFAAQFQFPNKTLLIRPRLLKPADHDAARCRMSL